MSTPERRIRALYLVPLCALLLALLATLAPANLEHALAKSANWERYDTTIDLHPDGTFTVTEDQIINFAGSFTQGYRTIPIKRIGDIRNVQVLEDGQRYRRGSDEPGTFSANIAGGNLEILWWFKTAVNESRHFTIRYDVVGGLRVYTDPSGAPREQLWWRPIDTDFAGDVRAATVTINLPQGVTNAQITFDAFTIGDFPVADRQTSPTQLVYQAGPLRQGNALEARLEFPRMTTAAVPAWQQADDKHRAEQARIDKYKPVADAIMLGVGLLLLVGGPILLLIAWYMRGRDAPVALPIDLLRAPPEDLSPGVVGTLLDEKADDRDVIATIVALGNRGVIGIQEIEGPTTIGLSFGKDYQFKRLKPDAGAGLAPFEQKLLAAIFGSQDDVKLSNVKERFSSQQAEVKEALYAELVSRGYFPRNPQSTRRIWRGVGLAMIALSLVGGCVALGLIGAYAPLVIFPLGVLVLISIAVMLMAGAMPRKTPKGAEQAAKWAAFRRYLDDIEKYENVAQAKEIFNRYLPYAVAFGLERSWVTKFASVGAPAPEWYGPGGFGGGAWSGGRRGGGGMVIIPGGLSRGDGGGGGGGGVDLPDLQDASDAAGHSLQGASDGLFGLFTEAAKAFTSFGGGGGRGGGGGFGGFSGGGGSFGGGGGGGGSGFR